MKWSQLKKRIENNFADSVKGRVEVWNTRYRKSCDREGEAWITIDKKRVYSFGTYTCYREAYLEAKRIQDQEKGTEAKTQDQSAISGRAYSEARENVRKANILPLWDINALLFGYLKLSIQEILTSENAIVRALGMIDKRFGKRRLKTLDVKVDHPLLKILYEFRCKTEGIGERG